MNLTSLLVTVNVQPPDSSLESKPKAAAVHWRRAWIEECTGFSHSCVHVLRLRSTLFCRLVYSLTVTKDFYRQQLKSGCQPFGSVLYCTLVLSLLLAEANDVPAPYGRVTQYPFCCVVTGLLLTFASTLSPEEDTSWKEMALLSPFRKTQTPHFPSPPKAARDSLACGSSPATNIARPITSRVLFPNRTPN